jgi:DNA repair protein RecN (Recombination protein N)
MLKKLSISNFTVIDQTEIMFDRGLCIITGETGAGKSIIMDALELILGGRTDSGTIRNKEKKCIVEATFHIEKQEDVKRWLEASGYDSDSELILRREFTTAGKSRAFLNDTPAPVKDLKQIRNYIINLHQQFDHTELTEAEYQKETLDLLAGCSKEARNFELQFKSFKQLQSEILTLQQKLDLEKKENDYRLFLLEELNTAGFRTSELEEAEQALSVLEKADEIADTIIAGKQLLSEGENPLLPPLKSLLQKLRGFAGLDQDLQQLTQRLESIFAELQDLSLELRKMSSHYQPDEQLKHKLEERLSAGNRLLKKHHVQTTQQLLEIQAALKNQLSSSNELELQIYEKNQQLRELKNKLVQMAEQLHTLRSNAAPGIATEINRLLSGIGMPNARFFINMIRVDELSVSGQSQISFLFNANVPTRDNKSNPVMQALGKVASGGELSRLMLCIQSLIADKTDLPVLVFDEIDTGISGEAAKQVGLLLKKLAQRHQLIAITHLPQVAALANTHLYVSKDEKNKEIISHVRKLSEKEHIEAIAKMISGNKLTESTMAMAKELANQR